MPSGINIDNYNAEINKEKAMRKLLTVILLLALCSPLFGQASIQARHPRIKAQYLTVTLDSSATATVYCLFEATRNSKQFAISETAPTSTSEATRLAEWNCTGDVFVGMVLETLTQDESDSFYVSVQPYMYDATKAAYYTVASHIDYLVLDTDDSYTAASVDYLDWTSGTAYGASLTGALWPTCGFVLTLGQAAFDSTDAATTVYLSVWQAH